MEKLTCECFSEVARNSTRCKLARFPFQVAARGSHLTIRGGSGSDPWWGGSHPHGCSHNAPHSSAHKCHPTWKTAVRDGNPAAGDLSQPFNKQHPPLQNTSRQHALHHLFPCFLGSQNIGCKGLVFAKRSNLSLRLAYKW